MAAKEDGTLSASTAAAAGQHAMPRTAVSLWMPDAWKALILIAVGRLDEAFARDLRVAINTRPQGTDVGGERGEAIRFEHVHHCGAF